jgi:chromosome partitioning protein
VTLTQDAPLPTITEAPAAWPTDLARGEQPGRWATPEHRDVVPAEAPARGRIEPRRRVVATLGWPVRGDAAPASALGWPRAAGSGAAEARDADLARPLIDDAIRTESESEPCVSRETEGLRPAAAAAVVSRETVDGPVATRAAEAPLSPAVDEAATLAPPRTFRTAGELAELRSAGDRSTPLARSVEHTLLVREGRRMGTDLPRPARTRVMVVANQKGGVGKTTSTVNLAAALAQGGLRVLVLDLDPQGNASTALAVDHRRGTPSVYDAVVDGLPLADVITASEEVPGLFVAPSTIDLAGAEIELVSMVAREGRLRRALHAHPLVFGTGDDRFDYVLIDCPPSLGLLTLNALVAGDEMMIPIQAEYYALEGLGQLLETVEMVRAHLNPDLVVSTILLTMYDARTRLSAGVADEVRTHFARQVLHTAIPRSVRISEAPSYGQTVMTYDPGSPGALSYLEAAREIALAPLRPADPPDAADDRASHTVATQGAS